MSIGFFIAVGIAIVTGIVVMLLNYVERPDNDSGNDGSFIGGRREHQFKWPPENERLSRRMRRWWEL